METKETPIDPPVLRTTPVDCGAAFASLLSDELTTFAALLQRVREGFAAGGNGGPEKPRPRRLSAA